MQPVAPHDVARSIRLPIRELYRHPFPLLILFKPDELMPEYDQDAPCLRLLDDRTCQGGAPDPSQGVPHALLDHRGHAVQGELARRARQDGVVGCVGDFAFRDLGDEPRDEVEDFEAVGLEAARIRLTGVSFGCGESGSAVPV